MSELQDKLKSIYEETSSKLIPENIKKDVTVLGVTGTLESGGGGLDTSDATATADDILQDKTAYAKGEKITGAISTVYSTKDTLVIKSMNIPDDIDTIIKFKIHLTTMIYATEDSIVLFDIVSKTFKKYTLSSLSIDSVKDVDISSNTTKIAITTNSNVVLFMISGIEIDISSKTIINYSYFNFFDTDDSYGAGAVSEYNTSKGSATIIFTFDVNSLTYNTNELFKGSAHKVGKTTNQGRALITYNTWGDYGWTIHPLASSFDKATGEIAFGKTTSDIQCSPNNKYAIGRSDTTFTVKDMTNATIKTFSKVADLFGFTDNDDVLYIVHANSLELYDFVNDKSLASYTVPIDITKTCIVDNGVAFYSLADNKLQYLAKEKVVLGFVKNGITYSNTSDATAIADDIIKGKTAYVNGEKITGTLTDYSNELLGISMPETDPYLDYCIKFPSTVENGKINNGSWFRTNKNAIAEFGGITPEKIVKGNTIFDVAGTAETVAELTLDDMPIQGMVDWHKWYYSVVTDFAEYDADVIKNIDYATDSGGAYPSMKNYNILKIGVICNQGGTGHPYIVIDTPDNNVYSYNGWFYVKVTYKDTTSKTYSSMVNMTPYTHGKYTVFYSEQTVPDLAGAWYTDATSIVVTLQNAM